MKTILAYHLAAFYLLISIGLTANIHYCGGKIQKVSFAGFSTDKSCCAGKPMKKGCCKDVRVCLKKTSLDQQTSSAIIFLSHALPVETFSDYSIEPDHELYVPKNIQPSVHAPPPELKIPIHLKHCVFII